MPAESYAAAGFAVRPANIGLSPEQIQVLSHQGRERIAAENAAKEAHKAQRAQLKAEAKARKSAKLGNPSSRNNDDVGMNDGDPAGEFFWTEIYRSTKLINMIS